MTTEKQISDGTRVLWLKLPVHPTNDPAGMGVYYDATRALRCGCDAPFFRAGVCVNHDVAHVGDSLRDDRREIERDGDIDGPEYKALLNRERENNERRAIAERIMRGTVWTRELAQAYGLGTYSPMVSDSREHRYRSDR